MRKCGHVHELHIVEPTFDIQPPAAARNNFFLQVDKLYAYLLVTVGEPVEC
jgi:hypothetical protein